MYLTGEALGGKDLKFGPFVLVGDGKVAVPPTTVASSFCSQQYVNTSPAVPVPTPVSLNAVLTGIVYVAAGLTPGLGLVTAKLVLTGQDLVPILVCIWAILL